MHVKTRTGFTSKFGFLKYNINMWVFFFCINNLRFIFINFYHKKYNCFLNQIKQQHNSIHSSKLYSSYQCPNIKQYSSENKTLHLNKIPQDNEILKKDLYVLNIEDPHQ